MAEGKKGVTSQDIVDLINIVPKETTLTFPWKFLFWTFEREYKLRPFSMLHKIQLVHDYGEKKFNEITSDTSSFDFAEMHYKIAWMLIDNKRDFRTYDRFLKKIIGFKKEVEVLGAAFIARGMASQALLNSGEVKEILEELKKNRITRRSTGAKP